MKHTLCVQITFATMLFVGCGGSDGGPSNMPVAGSNGSGSGCQKVSPCGGDLQGDWKPEKLCVLEDPPVPAKLKQLCKDVKMSVGTTSIDGSLSYKADMTFAQTGMVTADVNVTFAPSCLMQQGAMTTCADLQGFFKDAGQATCSSTSDKGCKCVVKTTQSQGIMGTYAINGNTVTYTAGSTTESFDYCVKESKLYVVPTAMMMQMASSDVMINGQIVLNKL